MARQGSIRVVDTPEERRQLRATLLEYEAWLPPDLRHKEILPATATDALSRDPNRAWLAYSDESPAGCVAAVRVDDHTLSLHHLYVGESARGLGLGRALAAAVIAYASERCYARVVLDTQKTRLATAYALYNALGFRECAAYGAVTYDDATFMELPLR